MACDKSVVALNIHQVVSSTNKTDRHGITEILLKVVINTINQTKSKTRIAQYYYVFHKNKIK